MEINSETEVNSKIDARKCASEIEMDLRDDLVGFNLFVGLFFVAHTPLQMYLKKRLPAGAGARGGGGGVLGELGPGQLGPGQLGPG